jgi:CBS domain-containing protein
MNHLTMEQILASIDQSEKFDDMRTIRDQVHEMIQEHLLFAHSIELHVLINQLHDALIKRTIYLAESQLEARGFGAPPVPYAFILFGSGGRSEQTLWSDQDNGFIYEDSEAYSAEELESYFSELIACILGGFEVLGYPPCQGNVTASNAQWKKSYSAYSRMMLVWFEAPEWENVRYLLILADMRSIYGDASLVAKLKDEFNAYVKNHPLILQAMLSNTLHHKVSLGIFGQLITERYGEDAGGVDIKYGAYIPIVNGIRLLAIEGGIEASSTLERLSSLIAAKIVPEHSGEVWRKAFIIALKHRDLTPFQLEDGLYTTRGKLSADQLNRENRQELKFCLRAGIEIQKFVSKIVETQIEKG